MSALQSKDSPEAAPQARRERQHSFICEGLGAVLHDICCLPAPSIQPGAVSAGTVACPGQNSQRAKATFIQEEFLPKLDLQDKGQLLTCLRNSLRGLRAEKLIF